MILDSFEMFFIRSARLVLLYLTLENFFIRKISSGSKRVVSQQFFTRELFLYKSINSLSVKDKAINSSEALTSSQQLPFSRDAIPIKLPGSNFFIVLKLPSIFVIYVALPVLIKKIWPGR